MLFKNAFLTEIYNLRKPLFQVIDKVLKKPDQYVVKPQREGGGNNIYGADIPAFLKTIVGTPEQDAYIVMDMISPPVSTNYMIRPLIKPINFCTNVYFGDHNVSGNLILVDSLLSTKWDWPL